VRQRSAGSDPADNVKRDHPAQVAADVDVAQAFLDRRFPDRAGYTIVVTNHGPSNVANVT
jgi:hypothetical protein